MGWLVHILGVDDVSGRWYGFWSGFGSDLSELALIGAMFGLLRKHQCHVRRCLRVGRFPVEGTPWTVCRRHHPGADVTVQRVRERYHLYLGKKVGDG